MKTLFTIFVAIVAISLPSFATAGEKYYYSNSDTENFIAAAGNELAFVENGKVSYRCVKRLQKSGLDNMGQEFIGRAYACQKGNGGYEYLGAVKAGVDSTGEQFRGVILKSEHSIIVEGVFSFINGKWVYTGKGVMN